MKIRESINAINQDDLRIDNYYFREEKVKVQCWMDAIVVTDLAEALLPGKVCREWSLVLKDYSQLKQALTELQNALASESSTLKEYIDNLLKGKVKHLDGFTLHEREYKAVRVFSPFVEVKPIKAPAKWTLSHVWKALLSGQVTKAHKNQRLTDDYAFDNAYNYQQGDMDIYAFAKEIIEHPSGWWVYVDKETDNEVFLSVNCHSFDHNTLTFNKNFNKAKQPADKEELSPGVTREGGWTWISFNERPAPAILHRLKADGWRWSKKRQAWYSTEGKTPPMILTA